MTIPARILIVKLGAIGDVLMALPAVKALRDRFGPAPVEIDWIAGSSVAPLLAAYAWVRVIPADERAILRGRPAERLRALGEVWRELRGSYDLCATLYYDPRYRVLTLPVRARRRVMLSRTDRAFALLPGRHHSGEFARILLDEPDSCHSDSVPPVRPDRLPESPLPPRVPGRRRIALVPGGASNLLREQALRRWPLVSYVRLAETLLERGTEILLLGGPDDRWAGDAFAHLPVQNMIGRLSLPEVIAVADASDMIISHDTGPLHLAGVSSALVVALFGPTDPGSFLPRRPGVYGIWGGEGFACRPCYDGATFAPCTSNGCMQQITPAMVLVCIDRALAAENAQQELIWPQRLVPSQLTAIMGNR